MVTFMVSPTAISLKLASGAMKMYSGGIVLIWTSAICNAVLARSFQELDEKPLTEGLGKLQLKSHPELQLLLKHI